MFNALRIIHNIIIRTIWDKIVPFITEYNISKVNGSLTKFYVCMKFQIQKLLGLWKYHVKLLISKLTLYKVL